MQRFTKRLVLAISLLILLPGSSFFAQQETGKKTLYERLGGIHSIAMVVDDFVERIWVNEVLNENPKNKEAMGLSKAALKYHVTELVGQVTGGPQKYTGRAIKDTHAGLNISENEWNAMAADFQATLDKFNVPEAEQQELFEIVGSTKSDVVMVD